MSSRPRRDFRKNNQKHNSRGRFNNRRDRQTNTSINNYNNSSEDRCKKFIAQEKLTESEAGITEYVSELPGFTGIIKARFSDFHVNEIDSAGEVAKLSDLSPPPAEDWSVSNVDEEEPELIKPDVISDEDWKKLNGLFENENDDEKVEIDVSKITKEERTKIHEGVKRVFGEKIVATTKGDGADKKIEFKKYTKGTRRDRRSHWPKDKPEYVYFIVYKESIDTMEATFKLSHCLNVKPSLFTYAGVKDKRAKTTQWFCVKKMNPHRLVRRTEWIRNLHVGNIKFKEEPLKLGQLKGNRFRIALRNVTAEDDVINEAMESLKSCGFINYYGLQRFGNDKEVPTFEIGIKLLQGNWKEACNLILKPKQSEDPNTDVAQAKRTYKETCNAKLASDMFDKTYNKCVESKLLLGFVKNGPNDYVNALENIPRNMRLLYIHSFQSLIWNNVVSKRIQQYGLKPVAGDIILLNDECSETIEDLSNCEDDPEKLNLTNKDDLAKSNLTNEDELGKPNLINQEEKIKILTDDDINSNKYTIYDIVLPLPGYDIKYPENAIKDYYKELLERHNLTLEMPKQKVKTYTLSGTYRKIVGRVDNLNWKTLKYNHQNDTLIRSDYEELTGEAEPEDNPNGQYKALIIDFCLNSSNYATMVLREILKIDTSANVHAKLNKYYDSEKQEDSNFAESSSLLSDSAKYEAFKQQIFGALTNENEENPSLKRKVEEQEDQNIETKRSKTEDDDTDAAIKMQPSLI